MSIEILDPTHESDARSFAPAKRLASLTGATIGIVSNGKKGTIPFFDALEKEFRERHGVAEVVRLTKANYSAPAEPGLLNEAARWQALIAGVGDWGSCSSCSLHDAIIGERLGLPSVGIMTSMFASAADMMARALGAEGYAYVVVDHPISSASPAALAERARKAAAESAAILLGRWSIGFCHNLGSEDHAMADKLNTGDSFPRLTLDLVDGSKLDLPDGLDARYKVILFYRGHWWPYCRRQLVGFEKHKSELGALGVKVVAASIDSIDKAKEVAAELSFPVGYGVTRAQADQLGSWWEERRGLIQPSEFLVDADGKVRSATYSSGPIGRVDAADVVKLVTFYDRLAAQKT